MGLKTFVANTHPATPAADATGHAEQKSEHEVGCGKGTDTQHVDGEIGDRVAVDIALDDHIGANHYVVELALHAGESRDLRTDLMVPNTIHDVVMARIDRLPENTKRLLQIAAVIGREFPLRLLNAVWKGSGSLEDHLRELTRLEFVYDRVEAEGSVYVFRHALTQETAYGSLLERHRRVYHRAIGRALEELHPERPVEVAELLALHFGRSDEAEKSVDYALLAGEKSQRRWANTEALNYFNNALHRLDLHRSADLVVDGHESFVHVLSAILAADERDRRFTTVAGNLGERGQRSRGHGE